MATRTQTGNSRKRTSGKTYASKSEFARALMTGTHDGKVHTIAEICRTDIPTMGYAFAYGIAKRLAASDPKFDIRTVAGERKTKTVVVNDGSVTVNTAIGPVTVDLRTGEVIRPKARTRPAVRKALGAEVTTAEV